MFEQVRRLRGGGPPGADAPTHWSRAGSRAGARSVSSAASAETVAEAFGQGAGSLYPEWNMHRRRYQPDWCTVKELDAPSQAHASVQWLAGYELRRPLAGLGFELERVHRQPQGEDIDIDAAIEARVNVSAGITPDESSYIDTQRQRRDLSVLILLDISGSVAQASDHGVPMHHQQQQAAAALATVLYEIGDRVALYAFHSQGRSAVHMFPVKRFDEGLDSAVMSRLRSLVPGAYSRLGAAIRHASTILQERSGTSRQLLLLLSDGLAYDHGYEPAYGAADARRALAEARRDGVGCLCISTGAATDTGVLRRVFGSAAFAAVSGPRQLGPVIGPLFRSALQAAAVSRRVA
jgi:nitric oxide reductase activation protein